MKQTFCLLLLAISINLFSQQVNIIPQPAKLKMGTGNFVLYNNTRIHFMLDEHKWMAQYLQTRIRELCGVNCLVEKVRRGRR